MSVTPETVFDLSVKHRIALSRFSTTVVRRVLALSNRVEKSVVAKIQDADVSSIAYTRLEQLLQEIRAIQASGWRVINTTMTKTVSDLAANEIAFASRLIGASTSVTIDVAGGAPSIFQVIAAANARPFAGRILKEWLADAEESQAKRVREIIRQGFVEGQTTDQMVRAIRGTKAAQYKDGALEVSRRGAETMVRTAITHTANVAHDLVFQANADIVKALRWTSVLDGRTSKICMARSGKEYPIDSGPRPPAHPNCRSVMVAIVDDIPGVAPFTPPTYAEWLKKQPAAFQDEVLGKSRGALFRRGGLSVDRFIDKAGHTLTLAELRQRDASAFQKAGLD